MVQFCQLGMLGNVWGIDGRGSVDENIKKARQAFFNCGSIGAFQGDLNPLSSRSILDACVMPILLYGFENWLMTHALMEKVESFQAELVKRVATEMAKASQKRCSLGRFEMQTMRNIILEIWGSCRC